MAKQKKGCGFLIAALILFIGGGVGAFIIGGSAITDAKQAGDSLMDAATFITPGETNYTSGKDGEISIWYSGTTTTIPTGTKINVQETQTGNPVPASIISGTQTMGETSLLGTFDAQKDATYQVNVTGMPDGTTILISSASPDAVMSTIGKGFGAIAVAGIAGFLALILGIIGLVKFFSSKKTEA